MSKPLPAFGFLTAVEDPLHGFFGGYLVVSERGLPLEFHCSTPVLPNEAQKILYGASLRPYLLGEIIGQTLVTKAQMPVQAVLTDLAEMHSLAPQSSVPVAWLRHDEMSVVDITATQEIAPATSELRLDDYHLLGSSCEPWQFDAVRDALTALAAQIDLAEPFERIREAIREAQRVTDHPGDCEHESSVAA